MYFIDFEFIKQHKLVFIAIYRFRGAVLRNTNIFSVYQWRLRCGPRELAASRLQKGEGNVKGKGWRDTNSQLSDFMVASVSHTAFNALGTRQNQPSPPTIFPVYSSSQ